MEENYDKTMGIIANCYYIFIVAILPAVIVNTTQFAQYSDLEQLKAGIYIQLVLFLIAATTIILLILKSKTLQD